jgi:hypothetical protein
MIKWYLFATTPDLSGTHPEALLMRQMERDAVHAIVANSPQDNADFVTALLNKRNTRNKNVAVFMAPSKKQLDYARIVKEKGIKTILFTTKAWDYATEMEMRAEVDCNITGHLLTSASMKAKYTTFGSPDQIQRQERPPGDIFTTVVTDGPESVDMGLLSFIAESRPESRFRVINYNAPISQVPRNVEILNNRTWENTKSLLKESSWGLNIAPVQRANDFMAVDIYLYTSQGLRTIAAKSMQIPKELMTMTYSTPEECLHLVTSANRLTGAINYETLFHASKKYELRVLLRRLLRCQA